MERVKKTKPCPYRKCGRVCHDKCALVVKYVPETKCHPVKYVAGKHCTKVTYHPAPHPYSGGCKPVYKWKKKCYTKKVAKEERVCHKVCGEKCHHVKAACVYFKVFRYPRFCAKAHCGPFKVHGNDKAPHPYNGKKGYLVKVIKGPRYDIKH